MTQGLSTFGRGAGVRLGDWSLLQVEGSDIGDGGWLNMNGLRGIEVGQSVRTERHLLRPYDVLVTARNSKVRAAIVPPGVSRTVASITVLVVRPHEPESGMGHFLWYYLSSTFGQAQLNRRLTVSPTVTSLSATNLREVALTVPSPQTLDRIARLVEVSEEVYAKTLEAAHLRRDVVRNAIIGRIES